MSWSVAESESLSNQSFMIPKAVPSKMTCLTPPLKAVGNKATTLEYWNLQVNSWLNRLEEDLSKEALVEVEIILLKRTLKVSILQREAIL
jgi:hypothetical protein